MTDTATRFDPWLGKEESRTETIGAHPLRGLAALLNRPEAPAAVDAPLPALWHWCCFLEQVPQSELAADGHPRRGGFLPPIELPRRMWAGGRLRFRHPLRVGESASRRSRIERIEFKRGRGGQLAFIEIGHEYHNPAGLAFSEKQDLVYLEARRADSAAPAPRPAPTGADFERGVLADAAMLFRYSALTFNAHRIHYDRDYAREVESYPGLVVHGPLLATLLLDELLRRHPGQAPLEYSFRIARPIFENEPFRLCGLHPDGEGQSQLWVADQSGALCVSAEAKFAAAT